MTDVIERGIATGELPPGTSATLLMECLSGGTMNRMAALAKPLKNRERNVSELVAFLLGGMRGAILEQPGAYRIRQLEQTVLTGSIHPFGAGPLSTRCVADAAKPEHRIARRADLLCVPRTQHPVLPDPEYTDERA